MDQLAQQADYWNGRAWKQRTLGLGAFSVGLGLAELLAPRVVARWIGVSESAIAARVLRGLGIREIANGVCLFVRPSSSVWLWSRVIGDLMDLALLGEEFRLPRTKHARLAAAVAAVLGVTAVDALSAVQLSRGHGIES
jgi:hypothetical protein